MTSLLHPFTYFFFSITKKRLCGYELPKKEKLSKPMAQWFSPTLKKSPERGVEKKKVHKDGVWSGFFGHLLALEYIIHDLPYCSLLVLSSVSYDGLVV